jgi:hypothetical protein
MAEQQKPVGPFEDFDACVAHFQGDEEVDDPGALCGWMEQNQKAEAVQEYAPEESDVQSLVNAMASAGADSVLTNLEVTYVSGVGEPAQDSQWVMAKEASADAADFGVNAPLLVPGESGHPARAEEATEEGGVTRLAKQPDSLADIDFGDYPEAAVENARMALEAREDHGNPEDCGTQVGWERANQLDNGEDLSEDTVARMAQFARHESNYDPEASREDCGWLMWKAWGGHEGIEWAQDKMDEVEAVKGEEYAVQTLTRHLKDEAEDLEDACWDGYVAVGLKPDPNGSGDMVPDCVPEDEVEQSVRERYQSGRAAHRSKQAVPEAGEGTTYERKAWAPVLIPNETDKQGDVIPQKSVEKAAHEYMRNHRKVDTDHDLLEGKGAPVESWTLKEARTFTLPDGTESREYPEGTWMLGVEFENAAWERVLNGDLTGFSIYGEAEEHSVDALLGTEQETEVAATAKEATGSTHQTMNSKQLDEEDLEEMVGMLAAYFEEEGGAVEETTLQEVVEWATGSATASMDDMAELAGEEVPIRDTAGGEMPGEDPEEEDTSMSTGNTENEEAEEEQSLKEMVAAVQDIAQDTRKTVSGLDDRVADLEAEVFEEAGTEEATEEVVEQAREEASEEVKSLLGLGVDEDLPEDDEERRAVVRKHLAEPGEDEGSGLGAPDAWSEDDLEEVL